MVLITVGSQKFQFNRLLEAVDRLVESGAITEEVFAQTGYSDYVPVNFRSSPFLDKQDYEEYQERVDLIITHGGSGSIVKAVKKGRKVIAVPRLEKYGEHVDDHQTQLISELGRRNCICGIKDCSELEAAIEFCRTHEFEEYHSDTEKYIESIGEYIRRTVT